MLWKVFSILIEFWDKGNYGYCNQVFVNKSYNALLTSLMCFFQQDTVSYCNVAIPSVVNQFKAFEEFSLL